MDLRPSPSQQHLNPSRSSSLPSQQEDMDQGPEQRSLEKRQHKLDLYSIPVFLLEVIVLVGLAYAAYLTHFQAKLGRPFVSGIYCDDVSYRKQLLEDGFTIQFTREDNELVVLYLLLAVPVALIVFCELVNSMFGSLKFRQVRAFCNCCKLHSITRRTFRFAGAYALGLLMVAISCDILATSTGRPRPYFAQECPMAYQVCVSRPPVASPLLVGTEELHAGPGAPSAQMLQGPPENSPGRIGAAPASTASSLANSPSSATTSNSNSPTEPPFQIAERRWIDLTGSNLSTICHFSGDSDEAVHKFQLLALSWPSYPAAIFTYSCIFLAAYLSFVGTARPMRIISSVLVMVLLLVATIFNVQLVKTHLNHADDVIAGAVLALIVVVFVLMVYLNLFKDSHYYQNQKLNSGKVFVHENFRAYDESMKGLGHYNLEQMNPSASNGVLPGGDGTGPISNNDLAMRYFQIPRANYRGVPRPLSSVNQLR